ncbi:MAG: helix-turn-helix domain-containing protein [Phycisphaerales bacterium]|nr:helix-turn-helix domain-containing protein [Phycisphaerales bacterium]
MASIGERIRERRSELEWTQDVLAQKAGISKGFLSALENGNRGMGADTLQAIAQALSLSLDFLMDAESTIAPRKQVEIPASLSEFAAGAGLSFKEVIMLLDMQRHIVAHRSQNRDDNLENVDWQKFYGRVKEFL